jgi:8-oxo-dGTP pyrophosphatase MutT (NUDIX family)
MIDTAELRELVAAWSDPSDGEAMKSQELILRLLDHTAEPYSRHQYQPGHVTCTGMVLHPDRDAVLLVHHRRLNRWLLPGGHVEGEDLSVWHAARREVAEETSVMLDASAKPYVAGLDVHGIPSNGIEPYHLHHDVIVGFQAASVDFAVSEESRAIAWCKPAEFANYAVPNNVRRAFAQRNP